MQQVNIKFNNVKQVQQFVNMIINFDAHVDLGCGQKVVNCLLYTSPSPRDCS